MAILVTRRWKEDRLSLREPWSASHSFDVTGTSDPNQALAQVPFQLNTPLRPGSRLVCSGPSIEGHPSSEHYIIRCDFRIPETGEFREPDEDPLNDPIEVTWGPVEQELPVDTDLDGLAIVNSAGDLKEGQTRPVTHLSLSLRKNYPYFNLDWFATWANSVNESPVTIGGLTFAAQHLYCKYPMPAAPYRVNDPFVPVVWVFELVPNGLLGPYPFQHRFADQGSQGWWLDGSDDRKAPFTTRNSDGEWEPISSPIRLNGSGQPLTSLYSSVRVASGEVPLTPPVAQATYQQEVTSSVVWRYYKRVRLADFSGIPL